MKRIAIVGGGPSGLFSTFMLEQKSREKLDVTLFETSSRLGGKVLTRRFDAAPVLYEAGVAELYGYGDDLLRRLVTKRLGLPVVNMTAGPVVLDGRVVRSDADIERNFGAETAAALADFRRRGRSARPYPWFYDGGWPCDNAHPWMKRSLAELLAEVPDDVARRFIRVLIHSDLATEPHLTSALYGIDNYLINESDYCQLYSIEGGIARLVQALAERVSARIELGARVDGIEKTGGGAYRVVFQNGARAASAEFDAVAVALPLSSLGQLTWGGEQLQAAMERHIARYDAPAHYLRITALFREPFWRGAFDESYFIHDAFGGCCVYDEGKKNDAGAYGVLSWLLSGSCAMAMSNSSDEQLIARTIDSLPAVIADKAAAHGRLVESHVHRWIGTVNGMPGGRPVEGIRKRHAPDPTGHPGLVVVGDYLFDSTVNGAFDSANITSSMILDHLGVERRAVGLSRRRPAALRMRQRALDQRAPPPFAKGSGVS